MATKKSTQKIQQEKFDFFNRPHHRTTSLTVDNRTFKTVSSLKAGEEVEVEFVNDIISSAKGGNSVVHHAIRRVDLLRRQVATSFRNVKVRTEMGTEINCLILGKVKGESDACTGRVTVRKRW